jgi:uncharacterized SAM-binding protein YcdF (DUF218 family)
VKRSEKAKRALTIVRRILAVLVLGIFALWVISAAAVMIWSSRDEARPADAIVVLGAAQYAGRPSPVLRARLDHGLDLWRRHLGKILILTGGTGAGDTTSESMRAVAGMLEARGLQTALLVSDPFHMLRLRVLARRFGFTPYTSPTRTSPISPNREQRWKYIFSESIKAPLAFFFERRM